MNQTTRTIGVLHTGAFLTSNFNELFAEILPDYAVANVVDESLIQRTIEAGHLTARTRRRVAQHLFCLEDLGVEALLVTCSSIGPAVDATRPMLEVPALRVDAAMAARAVSIGPRIGVLATLETTLAPTATMIREQATAVGADVTVDERVCEGAYEAVKSGDVERHDLIVSQGLEDLASKVDVVVLSQASMARSAELLESLGNLPPILTSPRLGVEALRDLLTEAP
ncbi:hypothetical protein BDK89_0479 [Ilumatobacter fluminis]|uniref:Asp/Glu/hydantoin racemase n=1 Tax=Ilumatobacter fluminis TaxID=467091 RepID=A0A4R7HVP7_9ACTN|nr:aspartate/glutamate racemase family protein [Ilumatobacter fluminis]TDT14920.1 hypothetical protein BDK89_0479 [Ilumatobacter fluminis]